MPDAESTLTPGDSASLRALRYQADAIRYAVLRKLAPGLRHAMMGDLQAIQLSAELAARMLRAGADLAKIRDNVGHLPQQCSVAVDTCRSVIAWLRPEENAIAGVGDGVRHCVKLAGDDWFLRGIEVRTEVRDPDVQVSAEALLELVVTALLILTDRFEHPADLQITVRSDEHDVDVVLEGSVAARSAPFPPMSQYRKLEWADLQLLARLHNVPCAYDGDRTSLKFARSALPPQPVAKPAADPEPPVGSPTPP